MKLRADLSELDAWVQEGIPGAAHYADKIRRMLRQLGGDQDDA